MIISVSGKIGSGKDTVGKIIQYLMANEEVKLTTSLKDWLDSEDLNGRDFNWKIHKWADALKQFIADSTGCTREQLEDREFKEKELGEEWKYWKVVGFNHKREPFCSSFNIRATKEECLDECASKNRRLSHSPQEQETTWTYSPCEFTHTYRTLFTSVGTDAIRNHVHPNYWVNALMSKYKMSYVQHKEIGYVEHKLYPNWIITDTRFPNELKAVKDKGGISIRVNRPKPECTCSILTAQNCKINCDKSANLEHESETALDTAEFDYVIENNGTIEGLIGAVKMVLELENII